MTEPEGENQRYLALEDKFENQRQALKHIEERYPQAGRQPVIRITAGKPVRMPVGHNGTLTAKGAPGHGAIFELLLPV